MYDTFSLLHNICTILILSVIEYHRKKKNIYVLYISFLFSRSYYSLVGLPKHIHDIFTMQFTFSFFSISQISSNWKRGRFDVCERFVFLE